MAAVTPACVDDYRCLKALLASVPRWRVLRRRRIRRALREVEPLAFAAFYVKNYGSAK